jgi:hypothetical protein
MRQQDLSEDVGSYVRDDNRDEYKRERLHYHQALRRLHTSAYVSIRQHTSETSISAKISTITRLFVDCIRYHTSACVSIRQHTSTCVSIRQRTTETSISASVSTITRLFVDCIRQHTSAYVSIRQHTSAYISIDVSIRQRRV